MNELNFKPLTPEQIEVRPTDTKYRGKCTLLLYIDSRQAAKILNDAVGVMNWQIEYKDVSGQIYGRLSIWDEDRNCWIYKEDTGEESNISEKKGQSSDIIKRCLARWGCDYLYFTPRVKINCPDSYYFNDKMNMTFQVSDIQFDVNKQCTKLVIVDRFGNVVYDWMYGQQITEQPKPKQEKKVTKNDNPDAFVPKIVYAKVKNAKTYDELVAIWNSNIELQTNNNFKRIMTQQKTALGAAS